jgi:hypothetical protein
MSIALEATRPRPIVSRPWTYEFRVRRSKGCHARIRGPASSRDRFRERDHGFGDPIVSLKRVPIPLIGPQREFLVTFPRATRRKDAPRSLPRTADQERDLPDLDGVIDQVDQVG